MSLESYVLVLRLGSHGTSHCIPLHTLNPLGTMYDSVIPWYIPLDPTPHTQSTWYHVGLCDPMVHPIGSDSTHSVPHIHPVQSVPCGTLGCHGTSHCIPLHTLSPTYTSRTKCTMLEYPFHIKFHSELCVDGGLVD